MINKIANTLYFHAKGEAWGSPEDIEDKVDFNFDYEDVFIFDPGLGKMSSRSTVGTVIDLAPVVRKHFASLPVSKSLNLEKGHFSPKSDLGKCPTCEGKGTVEVEMSFLEDMILTCEDCNGMKLRPFYATISDGHLTVHDAFNLPMKDVIPHIKLTPKFQRLWKYIQELRLDYLSLGRSLSSLSGGERQRVRLLGQLKKEIRNSILFFENLSAGLSPLELASISKFLEELIRIGNTIILIDQNPYFQELATHIINFPEDIS